MSQLTEPAGGRPAPPSAKTDHRATIRRACNVQAVSRPLELTEAMTWGAIVRDISPTGVGLIVCYPFKPGAYLNIEMETPDAPQSILARVVHATDQSDGTWLVGCELVKHLNDSELDILL